MSDKELARYNDIRAYTSMNGSNLEVLSSEEYSGARREFNDEDWKGAVDIVSRYYNLVLADCGAGLFQPAARGVLSTVSGLVIVASASIDGARQAAVTMDWLRQNGYQDLLGRSCVVINHVVPGKPNIDVEDLVQQFERHVPPGRVIVLPWDKHIAAGTEIQLDLLSDTFQRTDHRAGRRAVRRLRQARTPLTTTAAATSTSGVTPGRPSTTRVTILTGRRMTDLVLPASAADRDLHRRDGYGAGRAARGHSRQMCWQASTSRRRACGRSRGRARRR